MDSAFHAVAICFAYYLSREFSPYAHQLSTELLRSSAATGESI